MKAELYRKVIIKTEADLPKKKDNYFIHFKSKFIITKDSECYIGYTDYSEKKKDEWLKDIDWYLLPVDLPTDEEIENLANEFMEIYYKDSDEPNYESERTFMIEDFIFQAKWYRDKLLN